VLFHRELVVLRAGRRANNNNNKNKNNNKRKAQEKLGYPKKKCRNAKTADVSAAGWLMVRFWWADQYWFATSAIPA